MQQHKARPALVMLALGVICALALVLAGGPLVARAETQAVAAADAVEFLYIDQSSVAEGDEQDIAVSLSGDASVASGALTIQDEDTGAMTDVASTNVSGSALLFSFDAPATGSYVVSSLSVELQDGTAQTIDFSAVDDSSRSFSVVAGDEADGLSAYALDEDGNVVERDSVAGALAASTAGQLSAAADVGSDGILTVAIDPGHGGSDSGATGNGAQEAELNWKIANYAADELETYANVKVVLTRTSLSQALESSTSKDLQARVDRAVAAGADVLVSFHLNSADSSSAHGAEVWVPNDSSYNYYTHTVGTELGNDILSKLSALGLTNRGLKTGTYGTYADGSAADYLAINRLARMQGLTAVLIENAFISSPSDYASYLSDEAKLKAVGVADATGIAEAYGLNKSGTTATAASADEEDPADGDHVTIWRLYNQWTGEHLFTTDKTEYSQLGSIGWNKEGWAWTSPKSSGTAVYRLYNPYSGDHLYTTDKAEYDKLATIGWNQEGVAFYSDDSQAVAVYRLFNPYETIGTHLFTTSSDEYGSLPTLGWSAEGTAWYASTAPTSSTSSSATSTIQTSSASLTATSSSGTSIMGESQATKAQMVSYYNGLGVSYPASALSSKGAASISAFVDQLFKAAEAEGVRADVMFAQAMVETGNLQYGGQVPVSSCNYCGLKTADGSGFATFKDVYTGLLAQAQHLKAYASTAALNTTCVDPRFGLVTRGSATTVEALQGKWTPDAGYADSLVSLINKL